MAKEAPHVTVPVKIPNLHPQLYIKGDVHFFLESKLQEGKGQ